MRTCSNAKRRGAVADDTDGKVGGKETDATEDGCCAEDKEETASGKEVAVSDEEEEEDGATAVSSTLGPVAVHRSTAT
jgi:hypothetical protein